MPKMNFASIGIVKHLIDRHELEEASAIAINAFATYRVQVLRYVFSLKNAALNICNEKENAADGLILSTVVFKIFNTALNHLENYHHASIQDITTFTRKTLHNHHDRKRVNSKPILKEMRRRLSGYVEKVRFAQNAIRVSLSLIYALDKKGVSAVSISKSVHIH